MADKIQTWALGLPLLILFSLQSSCAGAVTSSTGAQSTSNARVASFLISEDFLNEQIKLHSKSELLKELKIALDPANGQIFFHGNIHVPVEELRALNLDPKLGIFHFQATIKPEVTRQGYLILEFPLSETFFYPLASKDPTHERIIIPVQLLSLALASARGYLAALSGDFSGFDRRTKKLEILIKTLDRDISQSKDADVADEFKTQRESYRLQLAAIPIERKQLEGLSKELEHVLGFTGEKELNINSDLGARKNALIFKIKVSQLAPYLEGTELAAIRILHDKKDGAGQNYLAIDVSSTLTSPPPPKQLAIPSDHKGMKIPPSIVIRLKQSLFESTAVIEAEKKKVISKIQDLDFQLKDDGLHVTGKWHTFLVNLPFDTVVDVVTTATDTFEVRVHDIAVAGIDLDFLSGFVLESMQKRFDQALKGRCKFNYVSKEKNRAQALQVIADTKALLPAFPDLHLIDVDIREQEFLLKMGRIN